MPSNLSADERAAVAREEFVAWWTRNTHPGMVISDPAWWAERIWRYASELAVVARAGEPVAWAVVEAAYNAADERWESPSGMDDDKTYLDVFREEYQSRAHPADARDRGDASADTRRLDWLESRTAVTESSGDIKPTATRDERFTTLRAAIDHAMHAAPAAPEDK